LEIKKSLSGISVAALLGMGSIGTAVADFGIWTGPYIAPEISPLVASGATTTLLPVLGIGVPAVFMALAVISTHGKDATLYINPQLAKSIGYKEPTGPRGLTLKSDVEKQLGLPEGSLSN